MPEESFAINQGEVMITPHYGPMVRDVVVKLGDQYHKLRQIESNPVSELIAGQKEKFDPSNWYSAGTGGSKIIFEKQDVERELERIRDTEIQKKARQIFETGDLKDIEFNPLKNIAVKFKDRYFKLKGIECDRASEVKRRAGDTYDPEDWYSIGTGDAEILINKEQVLVALEDISKEAEQQTQLLDALMRSIGPHVPIEDVISHVFKKKVTTIMNPEGKLEIVAKTFLDKGGFKIVQNADRVWKKNSPMLGELAETVVVAKPQPGIAPNELLQEIKISRDLIKKGVPNILRLWRMTRMKPEKVGIMMQKCEGGDFGKYTKSHFDPTTHTVLPQYRQQHLDFMRQAIKTFREMSEKAGLIHCDIKKENILIKLTPSGPQVRISDLGLATHKGMFYETVPGTYPSPDLMSPSQDIQVTEAMDAWAFGILLFEAMHQRGDITQKLTYKNSIEVMEGARKTILEQILNPNDPVDQIIAKLLTKDPSKKITLAQAKELLDKASTSTTP